MSILETGVTLARRYVVGSQIGAGGSSAVFRARDIFTGADVAIKILSPSADTLEWSRRFATEARACGRLCHPNIVRCLGDGHYEQRPYLVFELVEGGTLSRLVEQGPMDEPVVVEVLRDICAGLAHAHERGLVHRDVKPENIMIDPDGGYRLVDFGLAIDKSGTQRERLTSNGSVVGTPEYLAPEQIFGRPVDGRTDVFGLGITAYEMLTGLLPFDGPPIEIARQNAIETPPTLRARNPATRVSDELEHLVATMLERCPQQRPRSEAVLVALERLSRPRAVARRPERSRWVAAGFAAALCGAAIALRLALPLPLVPAAATAGADIAAH
jgi:serine/threonine-protein kinase